MRFFQRGETADSRFTFLDSETNEPVDVLNAQYKISFYDGPNEIIIIDWTSLTKTIGQIGIYTASWTIPTSTAELETYFVTARGEHPIDHTITMMEDFYRLLPNNYFGGGSGSSGGLVAKFTKP